MPVSQCETEKRPDQPTFNQVIIDICEERQDDWSRMVEARVNGAQIYLPFSDAQYITHIATISLERYPFIQLRLNLVNHAQIIH